MCLVCVCGELEIVIFVIFILQTGNYVRLKIGHILDILVKLNMPGQ